ncbi:MAG: hypothetical protein LBL84_02090 [Candidatus Nomurabacteria bacterium]|jgi:alpha-tubulin suppressor-like RCC1 family protein|nr:hypothetical protein [Candidatus Nomurabacteria bacterium]
MLALLVVFVYPVYAFIANLSYRQAEATSTTSIAPSKGPVAGGTIVTITGLEPIKFSEVAAGNSHSMGIDTDGNLYAWGGNSDGQVGNGLGTGKVTTPWRVNGGAGSGIPASTRFTKIAAGQRHSMAIDTNGNLYTWGYNFIGQIGNGSAGTANVTTPWQVNGGTGSGVPDSTKFSQIAAGSECSMAIDTNGNLYAWGSDGRGQISNGSGTVNVTTPWQINGGSSSGIPASTKFTQITASNHSMAIDTDGNLYMWGYNYYGQVGNGLSGSDVTTLWRLNGGTGSGIPSSTKFASAIAGYLHSMAIDTDGNLYTWGYNVFGQVGNGTTANVTTPWQVNGGAGSGVLAATKFAQVAAGFYHSMGIDTDGNLYTWGGDNYGQIGNGASSSTNVTTPWQVNGGTGSNIPISAKFSKIAGSSHSMAIDTNNNLYTWGNNSDSQIGDGTTTRATTPWHVTMPHVVTLGGAQCINVQVATDGGSLTCTTPAHMSGIVDVEIDNGITSTTKTNGYMYYNPMTISGISPNHGIKDGGTAVTISGLTSLKHKSIRKRLVLADLLMATRYIVGAILQEGAMCRLL